jgi:hypothetical protein
VDGLIHAFVGSAHCFFVDVELVELVGDAVVPHFEGNPEQCALLVYR